MDGIVIKVWNTILEFIDERGLALGYKLLI
jgi:hypothetical protein